ncbi:hypothetical protein M3Y94_00764700 [Aphelenchoides besseyi]|nr:hypothetical protein M3Y94_00764700 [Aphelenchoides besseyi]
MRWRSVQMFFAFFYVFFEPVAASPLGQLQFYMHERAPTKSEAVALSPLESAALENAITVEDEDDGPLVYFLPEKTTEELNDRLEKAILRARRSNHLGGTSAIDYKTMWPLLNAAKDRAVELANEGHRRAAANRKQPVTKRQEWSIPEPEERLARFSRNLPEQEKLYQIRDVGDLPMFRFG